MEPTRGRLWTRAAHSKTFGRPKLKIRSRRREVWIRSRSGLIPGRNDSTQPGTVTTGERPRRLSADFRNASPRQDLGKVVGDLGVSRNGFRGTCRRIGPRRARGSFPFQHIAMPPQVQHDERRFTSGPPSPVRRRPAPRASPLLGGHPGSAQWPEVNSRARRPWCALARWRRESPGSRR